MRSEVQILPDPPTHKRRCEAETVIRLNDTESKSVWGHSSAGRAPALHAGGQEFDPPWLHHSNEWGKANQNRRSSKGFNAIGLAEVMKHAERSEA